MKTSPLKKIISVFLLIIILVASWYYFMKIGKNNNIANNFPPVEVTIIEVAKKNLKLAFEYPGRVAGFREVEIKSQTSGILFKKLYQEGEKVKKDDILFKIDPKPFEAELEKSQSQLSTAKSNLLKAEKEWNRIKILYENKAVSAAEKDNILSIYSNALDDVKAAEANLKIAEVNISYTNIRSPIDGLSSKETKSEGNLVNINDIVTKIIQSDLIYINFAYPESDFYRMQNLIEQNKTTLSAQDKIIALIKFNGQILPNNGFIDFTDTNIDTETSSISSRIEVPNADQLLKSGQFVRIVIDNLILKDVIVIPEESIIQTSNGAIVYIIDANNKINVKPVKLGDFSKEGYIVESGLDAGDKLVIDGLIKVKPEQVVKIKNAIATDNK